MEDRLNKYSNDLDLERDKKEDILKELTNTKQENSGLKNETKKKDNDLFLINQKLSLNNDIYNALKLRFDELGLKYKDLSDELFLNKCENTKINSAMIKQNKENLKDKDQIEINNRDLMRKEANENSLKKQLQILREIVNAQDHLDKNHIETPSSIIKSIPDYNENSETPTNLSYIDTLQQNKNSDPPTEY